jgi:Putative Ig domain
VIANGIVIASTRPASLLEAVPSGSLDARLARSNATVTRAARAALAKAAASAVTCKGSVSASITSKLSFGAGIDLRGSWKLFGGLQSASLTANAGASASISATAKAGGSCKLKPTTIVSFPGPSVDTFVGPVPVVITSNISVDLDANASVHASVTTGASAGFSASAGIGWTKPNGFYPIHSFNPHFSYTPPTVSANATVAANLTPTVSVDLYGVVGPQLALKSGLAFNANISRNPWWTLDAPVDLTASIDIPPLKLSSPTLHVYQHTFPIANAGSGFSLGCTGGDCGPGASVSVSNPGNQTTLVGSAVNLQIQASDTDGGALSYSASGLPVGISIDPVSGVISGVPTATGAYTVTVTVTDATGPSGSAAFNWAVSSSPTGACEPSSSLSVMVNGTNVVSYVPHGSWSSGSADVSVVNVEGSSVPRRAFPHQTWSTPPHLILSPERPSQQRTTPTFTSSTAPAWRAR